MVLNLADYASADGAEQERRMPLACSGAITGAVGQPMLFVTIKHALRTRMRLGLARGARAARA